MPADVNAHLQGTNDFAIKARQPLFPSRSLVYAKRMTVGIRDVDALVSLGGQEIEQIYGGQKVKHMALLLVNKTRDKYFAVAHRTHQCRTERRGQPFAIT